MAFVGRSVGTPLCPPPQSYETCWHVLQITLNTTLRDEIASGYVVYEYITYPLECELPHLVVFVWMTAALFLRPAW